MKAFVMVARLLLPPWLHRFRISAAIFVSIGFQFADPAISHAGGLGATPSSAFRVPSGFQVEKVYEVPIESQGSWVCMTMDLKGRLITSDQYGKLYRVTPAAAGKEESATQVEQLATSVGMAQGLLHTQDGLYVNVNGEGPSGAGLYRLQDLDGDDQFEKVDHLIKMNAGGEHGPHAIIQGPGGRLFLCAGNSTDLPSKVDTSRVPRRWSEDLLLGRMPDARGFMADRLAPGGFVLSCLPDGSDVEIFATGFRNEYDIAFNEDGELFTFDSDMEWDIGTPWYVPTRVNHVTSGSEFGWRNGTGRWPDYFADSLGSVVNIGFGSPTGIVFATGAKFPAKYDKSLLIGDWSYGVVYAVSLAPNGSSYKGTAEPFISAAPLPVTDMVVDHKNGGIYVSIGGRKIQSAIYRVSYTGSPASSEAQPPADESQPTQSQLAESKSAAVARATRHELEQFHRQPQPEGSRSEARSLIFANIGSPDRALRFAARVALENQPVDQWRMDLSGNIAPQVTISMAIALARCGDLNDQPAIHQALLKLDWDKLDDQQRIELLRAYQLSFTRFGDGPSRPFGAIAKQVDHFPAIGSDSSINRELARLLVNIESPGIIERCVQQMKTAGAVDDQIHYAFCLREQTKGWTEESRRGYFQWFFDIGSARGGESFGGFIENIRQVAISKLSEEEKIALGDLVKSIPTKKDLTAELEPRAMVKEWSVEELATPAESKSSGFNYENGKKMFAVAQCYKCHRFTGQGGIQGPDLTSAGGRFSNREIVVAIVEPNKSISDQYEITQFLMEDDSVVSGRVANLNGDVLMIATNMLDPSKFTNISRKDIVETKPSPVSPMPSGLLNTLNEPEILDLLAYLRSAGNPSSPIYETAAE